jgi:LmbE family N-acetylglucosaminyl deacetylase
MGRVKTTNVERKRKYTDTIVVFCAHPDDEAIGMGGTIAKYASEGKKIICCIFTDGEASHPWEKKSFITSKRRREVTRAAKELGTTKIYHFGLIDGKLKHEIKKPIVKQVIIDTLKKYRPSKVFTHDADDMLYLDHTAVHRVVCECVDNYNSISSARTSLYTFNIWAFAMRRRNTPQLFVDITDTFPAKVKAIREFKTQQLALIQLWPAILIRAMMHGINKQTKYGENFYKIR